MPDGFGRPGFPEWEERALGADHGRDLQSAAIDASPAVLVVCTGNICRSPMAEGLLRERLARGGVQASVSSAGLVFDDREATPEAVSALARFGVDIRAHRSRVLTADMVESSDLIIGMERLHVREAILLVKSRTARCFTLKELVRRGESVGPRSDGERLERWLDRVAGARRIVELLGDSPDDDVADPYQQSRSVYQRCADEIDDLIERLVAIAWRPASEGVA